MSRTFRFDRLWARSLNLELEFQNNIFRLFVTGAVDLSNFCLSRIFNTRKEMIIIFLFAQFAKIIEQELFCWYTCVILEKSRVIEI